MRALAAIGALALPAVVAAQAIPVPVGDNPRVQEVRAEGGQIIDLTFLPDTAMTVVFRSGEQVMQAEASDRDALAARVSSERNTIQLLPQRQGELGMLEVITDRAAYRFAARTGTGSGAAYLVEVGKTSELPAITEFTARVPSESGDTWSYRLRGDRSVRPTRLFDDGYTTGIEFAPELPLPAVFAVGPDGKEQVVNGYMRGDVFVIDRVWSELVFRIDKQKATARRNTQRDDNG